MQQASASAEGRQMDEIVVWHRLQRFSRLTPCRQPADDDKRIESLFSQQVRHPGARGLARSSTVDVDVLILRKIFNLGGKVIRLNANRSFNAHRTGIVVPMAAYIHKLDVGSIV